MFFNKQHFSRIAQACQRLVWGLYDKCFIRITICPTLPPFPHLQSVIIMRRGRTIPPGEWRKMEEKTLDTIQNDHVVQIAYNLNVDGEEIESDLLEYLHGHGNIIPGLEQPLTGAKLGDTLEVIAKAEDAYGEFDRRGAL